MRPDVSDDFRIHFSSSVLGSRYADNGIKILPKNSISTFNFWYSLCLYRANCCRKKLFTENGWHGFSGCSQRSGLGTYVVSICNFDSLSDNTAAPSADACTPGMYYIYTYRGSFFGVFYVPRSGCHSAKCQELAACFTRLDGLFSILYNWFCFFRYCCPDTAAENNGKKFTALRWFYPLTVVLSTLIFGCAQSREQWFEKRRTQYKWQCDENTMNHRDKKNGRWESAAKLCFGIYLIHPVEKLRTDDPAHETICP